MARAILEQRSDAAKIYELANKQVVFFQTLASKECVTKMARAATDMLVWKRLYQETFQELSAVKKEAEALKSELGKQEGVASKTKQKCIEKLNEASGQWKQTFAEKVAEMEQDFELRMAEKDQQFNDFRASAESKIRDLERQLTRAENGSGLFDFDGVSDSRRDVNDAPPTMLVNLNKADFDFNFNLPEYNPSGSKNLPDNNLESAKAKRAKFVPSKSLKFRDSGGLRNATSGFGGKRATSTRRPTQTTQAQSSVFAAMSFLTGPSFTLPPGSASVSSRFEIYLF